MRAVVQRVTKAKVTVEGEITGEIGRGLLVLIGAGEGDTQQDQDYIVDKLIHLRIFSDDNGKMNNSVQDIAGAILLVSQFTLYGDARKGRRPAFTSALEPQRAKEMYLAMIAQLRATGVPVACGVFGADMQVELINDGPVTIMLDSKRLF